MAATWNDHIHLGTDTPPTAEYPVAMEGFSPGTQVPMSMDRGFDGTLHMHRLLDAAGDPVQIKVHRLTLILTNTQKLVVEALQGKAVYYIPHWHDAANHAAYDYAAYFRILPGGMTPIDPMATYWEVSIEIIDNSI